MKNKNKIISLLLSLSLVISIFAAGFSPLVSHAAEETVYIDNAAQLVDLAKKCSFDAWSVGKTVVLRENISLEGVDFEPIPTFSGTFDGNGYTISGLTVAGAYSPAGFISYLCEGGVVKNLTLSAVITPDGDKGYVGGIVGDNAGKIENCKFNGTVIGKSNVGGIAGINRASGTVSGCAAGGEIIGEERVGGIVGTNNGLISSSVNQAKVNTIAISPSISLSEINLSLTFDITKLPSLSSTAMTDVGGVAGYSSGIILGSVNSGSVGYPHMGYNIGGIAGRSCGHLNGNINQAKIFGRKDVGGIVGQAEPHISYDLSEDLLAALQEEINAMSAVIDGAVDNTGTSLPTVSARLDSILTNLDLATDSLNTLLNDGADLGNDFIGEINRTSEVLDEVLSQLAGITSDVPTLTALLESSIRSLELTLADVEKIAQIGGEAISDLKAASDDISLAFGKMSDSLLSIESGLTLFKEAININDKDAAKASLDKIADGISTLVSATDEFALSLETVSDILDDAKWVDKSISEIDTLAEIFVDMSEYLSALYEATTDLSESIEVDWSKMTEAADELSGMIGHLADAVKSLGEALTLMESGIETVSEGLTLMGEAITVNDQAALENATKQIADGISETVVAFSKMSEAMGELSEIMGSIDTSDSLVDIFSDMSASLGDISDAGVEMSEAMLNLGDGLYTLLENIEIDPDQMSAGGALVIAGMDDILAAMDIMSDSMVSLSEALDALDRAITAIRAAVLIKDEQKLNDALSSAYDAIGGMIGSMGELADLMSEMTNTMKEAKLWSDGLIDALSVSVDAITKMTGALVTVQEGIDELRQNVTLDIDKVDGGLDKIRQGLVEMAESGEYLEGCFGHISDALTRLEDAGVYLPDALSNLRQSLSSMADAMDLLTSMSDKIALLVGYLDGVEPILLPTINSSTIETANQLFVYISAIESELKYLNEDITSLSTDMVERVGRLNEIFNNISNNIINNIYDLQSGDIIDSSVDEDNINQVTEGKIFGCENTGSVEADYNVGGIAGAMGLESSIDPEDDISDEISLTQRKKYKLQVVIHACKNDGNIISKYDCAGGVVGKMDMGLVYGCESCCDVSSTSGGYVGGIAGITSGLISQCFAKNTLSGGKYVGGIVGSGESDAVSGDSSTVRNCYSMVVIKSFTQYGGAISGVNVGNYAENLFVSDNLAGIDRVSYVGKAEPISYEDLIKRRSLPTGFYRFTLDFVVDGEIIHSVSFDYGTSFDSSVFPEMPVKEGHYGRWDRTDLTHLTFDTTVSALYSPYLTTINSEEKRENGKNIFFVIGEFTAEDKLTVNRGCDTSALALEENAITKDRLVESWTLTIPSDSLDKNNVHFISEVKNCKIFVKVDGVWEEVETKAFGSYLTFDVSGETVEFAVVESQLNISIEIIILIALVLAQAVVIICILVSKKKNKKKNKKA